VKPINLYSNQNPPQNVGPKDRPFEIRITDMQSKNVYAMTVRIPSQEFRMNPIGCFETLRLKFGQLCRALWLSGTIPELPVEVVDVSSSEVPQKPEVP
jgi:hypothetical protein